MHVKIQPHRLILVGVMPFGRKDEVWGQLRIAPERTDAGDNVSEESGIGVASKLDGVVLECWAARKLLVDDLVEFLRGLEGSDT